MYGCQERLIDTRRSTRSDRAPWPYADTRECPISAVRSASYAASYSANGYLFVRFGNEVFKLLAPGTFEKNFHFLLGFLERSLAVAG